MKMDIREKIKLDFDGLTQNGPINIVIFGDSVSHGALCNEIDYETVYWNRLKKKINGIRNYVPVNMINASIGGVTAKYMLDKIEDRVLKHEPDLVIVCFGLNDVNGEIEDYLNALEIIFTKCRESGSDVIFMSPNMLNTYSADDTQEQYKEYSFTTAEYQNSGRMDKYIYSACDLARKMNVKLCDCYSEWKKLSETEDVTMLLANRINHPTREMHELFANMLFDVIFGSEATGGDADSGTMYKV